MSDTMTLSAPVQQVDTSSQQQSESVSPNASLYETSSSETTQLSAANTSGISMTRTLDLLVDHSEGLSPASNSSGASLSRTGSNGHASESATQFGMLARPKTSDSDPFGKVSEGDSFSKLSDPAYSLLSTICAGSWPQASSAGGAVPSFQQSVSVPCSQQNAGTNATHFSLNDSGIDVGSLSLQIGLLSLTQSTESALFSGNTQPSQQRASPRNEIANSGVNSGWPSFGPGAGELLGAGTGWPAGTQQQPQPHAALLTAGMSRQTSGVSSLGTFGAASCSPAHNSPNNELLKARSGREHQPTGQGNFGDGVCAPLETQLLELIKAQQAGATGLSNAAPGAALTGSGPYAVGAPAFGRSLSHSAATGYNHHASQSSALGATGSFAPPGSAFGATSNGGSVSSLIDPSLLALLGRQAQASRANANDSFDGHAPFGAAPSHGRAHGNAGGYDRHGAHDRFGNERYNSHSHTHGFGSVGHAAAFDRSGGGPVISLLSSYQHAMAHNSSHHSAASGSGSSAAAHHAHTHAHGHSETRANERYSRKVFVGGLPPDVDEEEIANAFSRFGALVVDWPHKAESKSYFPPKGYCFLLFQEESSVHTLLESCVLDCGKFYWVVSSPTVREKPVQIRPWELADSDCVMDPTHPLDPRKTIFVGGVPRPLKAAELAIIMDRYYGNVCYAGIDTDPELKYPKGAGRVAFSSQQSYIAAISARFVQLQIQDIDKRVEVKPYVLDDQMCDECGGTRCGGKYAPFFCGNVTCLQYYCEFCWAAIHSRPGREYHKPLVKEGADRPRAIMPPFTQRW